jgi:hypothetical protein
MSESITKTQSVIQQFLEAVEEKTTEALAEGRNLPATKLARDLAPRFGWEWPQAYHLINIYMDSRPELEIGKGPKGGIRYRKDYLEAHPELVKKPQSEVSE